MVGESLINATIIYANSTNVITSAQNAIDQDLAPVISMSYGLCESMVTPTEIAAIEQLLVMANTENITFLASSGDEGAAACDFGSRTSRPWDWRETTLPAAPGHRRCGNEFSGDVNNS